MERTTGFEPATLTLARYRDLFRWPELTPTVRLETSEATKPLFKPGISLSGWGDLNSRPSVPQIDAPQTADLRKHPETACGLPF